MKAALVATALLAHQQLPPQCFDHAHQPVPIVRYVERADFMLACWTRVDPAKATSWKGLYAGCSDVRRNIIYVWAPIHGYPGALAYVIRHENGHLNGWPADHSRRCK